MSRSVVLAFAAGRSYIEQTYVLVPQSLFWNTGNGYKYTSCLNIYGNAPYDNESVSDSKNYYIGNGSPDDGPNVSMSAGSVIGFGCGSVTRDRSRTQVSGVGSVTSYNATVFTRTARTNDTRYGTVDTNGAWDSGVESAEFFSHYYRNVSSGTIVETVYGSRTRDSICASEPKSGSQFLGWFVNGEQVTSTSSSSDIYVSPSNPRLLYIKSNHKADVEAVATYGVLHTLTYDANGGTPTPESATGYFSVTLAAAITRAGHEFGGWKIGDETYSAGATYTFDDDDATAVAQWTPYVVTYNANGGSVSPSSDSGVVTLPAPTRTGYNCTGWYTAATGGTKAGDPGATYTPTADVILYARWAAKKSALTFDANGGTGTMPTGKVATYGAAMPAYGQSAPTRTGYDFAGFYDAKTDGEQYYTAALASASTWDKDTSAATTLYARWTPHAWTVTFNPNGGAIPSGEPTSKTVTFGQPYGELTTPARTGYTFAGWWFSGRRITAATVVNTDENHTINAGWTANTYTVKFDALNGAIQTGDPTSKLVTFGQTYGELPTPARAGYTFKRWVNATNTITADTVVSKAEDHKLFAEYAGIPYVVKIDLGIPGTTPETHNAVYGENVEIEHPATRAHYRFLGWRSSGVSYGFARWGRSAGAVDTLFSDKALLVNGADSVWVADLTRTHGETITFTAQWERISYTVNLNNSSGSYNMAARVGSKTLANLLAGKNVSATVDVNAGDALDIYITAAESVRRAFNIFVPLDIHGNSLDRSGSASDGRANFKASHTFGDDEAAVQDWTTVRYAEVVAAVGSNPLDEDESVFTPSMSFADGDSKKVRIEAVAQTDRSSFASFTNTPPDSSVSGGSIVFDPANGTSVTANYQIRSFRVSAAFATATDGTRTEQGMDISVSVLVAGAAVEECEYGQSATWTLSGEIPDGYVFAGWYADAECTERVGKYASHTRTVAEDTVLYAALAAKVTVESVVVAQDVDGDVSIEGVDTDGFCLVGGTVKITAIQLGDSSYFGGWYDDYDGSAFGRRLQYAQQQEIVVDRAMSLFAKFTNVSDVFYVALYSRAAAVTKHFVEACTFAATGDDGSVEALTAQEYSAESGIEPFGDPPPNAKFYRVTGITRMNVVMSRTDAQKSTYGEFRRVVLRRVPDPPSGAVETEISAGLSFSSVVDGNVAYFAEFGGRIMGRLNLYVPNEETGRGVVRVGDLAENVGAASNSFGVGQGGDFERNATATAIAMPRNGWRFAGWYSGVGSGAQLIDKSPVYQFTMPDRLATYGMFARFVSDEYELYRFEGSDERLVARWKSKVYELSKPANLTSVRIDTQSYAVRGFRYEMFSSPDTAPDGAWKTVAIDWNASDGSGGIASQTMRRLPQRRPERYFQVEVRNDAEVDAITIGTSGEGLAT